MDQAIAAIEQRFHLSRDTENVVRAGENKAVAGKQFVFDPAFPDIVTSNLQ